MREEIRKEETRGEEGDWKYRKTEREKEEEKPNQEKREPTDSSKLRAEEESSPRKRTKMKE